MRHGFKSWCEKESLKWRKKLNLQPYQHLPARALAAELLIDVITPKDIPGLSQKDIKHLLVNDSSSWSALTVSAKDCTIIINNPHHSKERQESNIMHELAHILCGHQAIGFKWMQGFPFPFREFRPQDEKEAEWLGGCLQIPRQGLLRMINQGMTQNERLIAHFVASNEMVQFRRNKTGVDKQIANTRRRYIKR